MLIRFPTHQVLEAASHLSSDNYLKVSSSYLLYHIAHGEVSRKWDRTRALTTSHHWRGVLYDYHCAVKVNARRRPFPKSGTNNLTHPESLQRPQRCRTDDVRPRSSQWCPSYEAFKIRHPTQPPLVTVDLHEQYCVLGRQEMLSFWTSGDKT